MILRELRDPNRPVRRRASGVLRTMALGTLVLSSGIVGLSPAGCSHVRSPSRVPEPPARFELTVSEVRDESVWDARSNSTAMRRSESTLRHFGRIERAERDGSASRADRSQTENDGSYAVFNDSLVFRSESPFRYAALMRRDTLAITSMDGGPSTSATALASDRAMLACIFDGPALEVTARREGEAGEIVDFKKACAGGVYRRLNLPATLGAFVIPVPAGHDRPGARWEIARTIPGFSGLGSSPTLTLRFSVGGTKDQHAWAAHIEVSCDTTFTNVRTVTPAGDPIDIISHRVRVRGAVRAWPGLPHFHTGALSIEEDIRYVRPDLESPVLEKRCRAEIVLDPR